jgi:hypothetical protein
LSNRIHAEPRRLQCRIEAAPFHQSYRLAEGQVVGPSEVRIGYAGSTEYCTRVNLGARLLWTNRDALTSELDSVVRCIELWAEDYLPKPFNPTLLRARVSATLEKKRLHDEIRGRTIGLRSPASTSRSSLPI